MNDHNDSLDTENGDQEEPQLNCNEPQEIFYQTDCELPHYRQQHHGSCDGCEDDHTQTLGRGSLEEDRRAQAVSNKIHNVSLNLDTKGGSQEDG